MLLKYKKVLATVSVIINVFGWGCLAGAIKVTGDLIFPALASLEVKSKKAFGKYDKADVIERIKEKSVRRRNMLDTILK